MSLFDDFEDEVIKRFEQYQLPVIELKKETPKEAVCLVFRTRQYRRRCAHRVRVTHGLVRRR